MTAREIVTWGASPAATRDHSSASTKTMTRPLYHFSLEVVTLLTPVELNHLPAKSRCALVVSERRFHMTNRHFIVLFSGYLLVMSSLMAQTLPPNARVSAGVNAPFLDCQKRFREGEIRVGSPHQAGAMKEICLNVEVSCDPTAESNADCARAKNEVAGLISRTMADRDATQRR